MSESSVCDVFLSETMQGGTDEHMNVANNNRDTNVCMYCFFVAESGVEFVPV